MLVVFIVTYKSLFFLKKCLNEVEKKKNEKTESYLYITRSQAGRQKRKGIVEHRKRGAMGEKEYFWERGRKLGQGAFGSVYLAKVRQHGLPSFHVAVKTSEAKASASLRRERKLLQEFDGCPQIIRSLGDDTTVDNAVPTYNLMLEYASGGSLADRIKEWESGTGLSQTEVRRHAKSVLLGLSYMHKKGYAHCDIKPHNILLVPSSPSALETEAKIADLGLAMKAGKLKNGLRGTPMYMAPESVRHGVYEGSCDVWAFGCTVLEMLTGEPPWDKCKEQCAALFRVGFTEVLPEIPRWLSKEARDFLSKCLVRDPKSRWSADMLLKHPFVSAADDVDDTTTTAAAATTACSLVSNAVERHQPSQRHLPFKKRKMDCNWAAGGMGVLAV